MTTISAVVEASTTELVSAAIDGDQRAWDQIVDRYHRLVWHIVRGFRQLDPASMADANQTTWLRLAENLERVKEPEHLASWLATTARRECIRLVDRASRVELRDEIEQPALDEPLDLHLIESERDVALWRAFSQLDEGCRTLLTMVVIGPSVSYDQVAVELDMKRGSIGPTRGRCLEKLRGLLDHITGGYG